MQYIVVDFEWNQAMSSKSPVFNRLPIHLRGEIIEIGAVKLNENFQPTDEFTVDIKPIYFKRMHYKVKKLTGFDAERLANGLSFEDAFEKFKIWCGNDVTFLTWGYDDQGIFEQNIIVHDLDWDWIAGWMNLQLVYNVQTGGDKNQKSLSAAMEHFEIEQTRTAHDALGDAYNTALVCTHLNLKEGLTHYEEAARILSSRNPKTKSANDGPDPIEHLAFNDYISKAEAFADEELIEITCPLCGEKTTNLRWINQGDQRYMNLYTCPNDKSNYLVRLKFHKSESSNWSANRLIYEAKSDMVDFYKNKSTQSRRRGRSHSSKKNRPAK